MKFVYTVILTCLMVAATSLQAVATEPQAQFDRANSAYSKGDYTQAIELYTAMINDRGYSAPVLFNLANSYAINGQIGLAVLNYERALVLAPGDSDIAGNLHLVRTTSGLFEQEPDFSERLIHALNINQWTILGTISILLITITMVLGLNIHIPAKLSASLYCGSLLVAVLCTFSVATMHNRLENSIVISESRLQVSPFTGAASAGELREGSRVYVSKRHGDYLFVLDDTQRKGWIAATVVEPILPQ